MSAGGERAAPPDLGFVHRYLPPVAPGGRVRTLLLLHGTGGDEGDLVPLGRALDPGAALLSPRGKVLERGMPRFFRRLAEGVFDHEDLVRRTHELAAFVCRAADAYGSAGDGIVAVGFSNGANIGAALLLLHPGLLSGAVLLRPRVPLEPDPVPDLGGTPVLLAAGRHDPIVPPGQTEALAGMLSRAGADVELRWAEAGHALAPGDVEAAREFLAPWRDLSA